MSDVRNDTFKTYADHYTLSMIIHGNLYVVQQELLCKEGVVWLA